MQNYLNVLLFSILSLQWTRSIVCFFPLHNRRSPPTHQNLIKDQEIKKTIKYTLPPSKQNQINKLDGFFGIIGPNINFTKNTNLLDLFIGDGIIQGVFFRDGQITFVKQFIKTEKILHEEKYGKIPDNIFVKLVFYFLHSMKMMPNVFGVANTALLKIKSNIYALYEKDSPYKLHIDFDNTNIQTIKKVNIEPLHHFSAHSKIQKQQQQIIETIDYNIFTNTLEYYQLNQDFVLLNKRNIQLKYMPLVHDFLTTPDKLIIIDSPLTIDQAKRSLVLHQTQKTIIRILNKETDTIESYETDEVFFIFHYAGLKEDATNLYIYASVYNNIDFTEFQFSGKYRKIIVNKLTKKVTIERDPIAEMYNLDFPISFNGKTVFTKKDGIAIFKDLTLVKDLTFRNKYSCGESAVTYIDNVPYLLALTFDKIDNKKSFLILVNLNNYEITEISLDEQLHVGFHSIFVPSIEKLI
uniref:Dioxygenase n=1 Tax=viral metagenome TaxID=1070528 RepID=A0A6C0F9P1_9ZZZZ